MKSAAILAAIIVFLMPVTSAVAYTSRGDRACSEIVEDDAVEEARTSNRGWVYGFFIGRNAAGKAEVGKGISLDQLYATALEICRNNPDVTYYEAVDHLYNQLD